MNLPSCLPFAVAVCLPSLSLPTLADQQLISSARLGISLADGSQLKAVPLDTGLKVNPSLADAFALKWQAIEKLDLEKGAQQAVMHLRNGDRLTVEVMTDHLRVGSVLGQLSVPLQSIREIKVTTHLDDCRNVALGKPVHGVDGASNGKGLAKHITDGNPTTHAKPPASNFDYRIDLQNGTDATYQINEIVINWGYFGDRFKGVREKGGEGWANAAWPGDYVASYVVECRKADGDGWQTVHEHRGRPAEEVTAGVIVEKQLVEGSGYTSISKSRIIGLDLRGVAELRIRAKGSHWIGLFEFEALGTSE